MTDLRVLFADEGADVFWGEQHLGTITAPDGIAAGAELTIPADLLINYNLANQIRTALEGEEFKHSLEVLWAFLAEKAPDVDKFVIEYDSEYDDQGGYYSYATSDLSDEELGPDGYDEWLDLLNLHVQDNFFPADEYTRP